MSAATDKLRKLGAKRVAKKIGAGEQLVSRWIETATAPPEFYQRKLETAYGIPLPDWEEPQEWRPTWRQPKSRREAVVADETSARARAEAMQQPLPSPETGLDEALRILRSLAIDPAAGDTARVAACKVLVEHYSPKAPVGARSSELDRLSAEQLSSLVAVAERELAAEVQSEPGKPIQ